MSFKFIKPAQSDNCVMVKIDMDGKPTWLRCSQGVKDYAKKNFIEGDEVEFEFDVKDDDYIITSYIKKVGESAGGQSYNPPPESSNKSSKSSGKYTKSTSTNESIKRQAIGHMTSRTLIALQGHVNPNNILEMAETIYTKYQELVG